MNWIVYLSGEIHTDWRQQLSEGAKALDLPVSFSSAVTDHEASDAAGMYWERNRTGSGVTTSLQR